VPPAVSTTATLAARRREGGAPVWDLRRRKVRVLALLTAVILLSLGDLYMTLVHVRSVGMFEGNPVARTVMAMNSPALLAGWKLATVVATVGILYWVRRTRQGELGAWLCLCVLTWLTLRWATYSDTIAEAGITL
jgi:hypothetical protein